MGCRLGKPTVAELLFEPADVATDSTHDFRELVAVALNALPNQYREVIELKIFAHLTFAEISAVLGSPPGTVATWYRRGLAQMRETLTRGGRQ